jgi:D-ribose pyranase
MMKIFTLATVRQQSIRRDNEGLHRRRVFLTLQSMLINGIINPHVQDLVCRIRHTNMLVIADAAFPFWPQIETVDISLVRGVPTIIQVLDAILPNFKAGPIYMAEEFKKTNPQSTQDAFAKACRGVPLTFEPHMEFKRRVPHAIGLIRTGDTTAYGNMILVSV